MKRYLLLAPLAVSLAACATDQTGGINSPSVQRACAAASVAGATVDTISHDIGAVYPSAKVQAIITLVQLGQAIIQANCQVIVNQSAPPVVTP